jgi:hypothetical protein
MSISLNKQIENVQLEASRIVTGGTRLVSRNNLYMETGWVIANACGTKQLM